MPDPAELLPDYLNLWLNDANNQTRVKQLATFGVQQANVNPTNLGTLEAAYPRRVDEQQRIIGAISACTDGLSHTLENLAKLRSLKTALMQDLLTAKRRVTALLAEADKCGSAETANRPEVAVRK